MLLIGTKNTIPQTVLAGEQINIGNVYRKYCKRVCGLKAFNPSTTSITLQAIGMYHITAVFEAFGTVAGDVTIQLNENGVATNGVSSTETITTAGTETRTFVIDYYVKVDNTEILCQNVVEPLSISFTNTGVGATITSAIVNIEKVV